ncbi:MAG: ABC transporter permease subunit, partial [Pseudothermotoga sp.]
MSWTLFLQHLANGIALGFVFGLVAIGYTLVYGVVKLVNFAHGDIFMMACFFVYY